MQKLLLLLLFIVLPVGIRVLLLVETSARLSHWDGLGFIVDIVFAVILFLLYCRSSSMVFRTLILSANILVSILYLTNMEHVIALNTIFSLENVSYLTSDVFIKGSFLTLRTAVLFFVVAIYNDCIILVGKDCTMNYNRTWSYGLILGGVLTFSISTFYCTIEVPLWRQQNVAIENLRLFLAPNRSYAKSLPTKDIGKVFERDLSGIEFLSQEGRAKNVLIILVEGLSFAHVRPFESGDVLDVPWMPKLSKWAEKAINYQRFISMQRQTNRGEFAVLCGNFPNFEERKPKMDLIGQMMETRGLSCLPREFQKRGYLTSYVQSAKIEFMHKDRFMPLAGFSHIIGQRDFKTPRFLNQWGVSDFDLYGRAFQEIRKMHGEKWFMTLLTVGTHHPYQQLPEYKNQSEFGAIGDAMLAADDALDGFLNRLQLSGNLKDTLVLITGDESFGAHNKSSFAGGGLASNWSYLIAIEPQQKQHMVKELFSQVDLSTSVLDYLGIPHQAPFLGRSIFRQYNNKRIMPFANIYDHTTSLITENDQLVTCLKGRKDCFFENLRDDFFAKADKSSLLVPLEEEENADLLRHIIRWNDYSSATYRAESRK